MGKLHIIDVSIVVAYLILCLVIGLYKSTKIKNIKEYTLGNKNFSTFAIVATIFATYTSGATIGESERVYEQGLIYILFLLFNPLHWITTSMIFVKNISSFKGCISLSDIMYKLYGAFGRYITDFAVLIFGVGILAAQSSAIGYFSYYFFDIPHMYGVLTCMLVVILYSALGGINAVVITDIVQFAVFLIVLPIICSIALFDIGISYSMDKLSELTNSKLFHLNIQQLLSYALMCFLPICSAPYIQRLLMVKSKKEIKNVFYVITLIALLFNIVFILIAILAFLKKQDLNPKLVFFFIVDQYSHTGIKGIVFLGLLAMVMSTADSWLNTLSSMLTRDLITPFCRKLKDASEVTFARCFVVILGIATVIVALISREIIGLVWAAINFWYPLVLIPLVAGFLLFRTNLYSFVVATILSVITTLIGKYYAGEFGVVSLAVGVIGSAIGFFSAHYIQVKMGIIKKEDKNDLMSLIMKHSKPTLKERMKKYLYSWVDKIEQKTEKELYYTLGLFLMILNIPIMIFGYYVATDAVNFVAHYSRYLILFLGLIIILHELIGIKDVSPLFYTTLCLALPLFNTYLFIISGYKILWGINCVISVCLLFFFIHKLYAVMLGILGVLSSFAIYRILYSIEGYDIILDKHINKNAFALYALTASLVMIGYLMLRKYKKDKQLQVSLEALGHSIVHDARGPCFVTSTYLYLIKKALKDKKYDKIPEYVEQMELSNDIAQRDIKILLENMSDDLNRKSSDWGEYSARDCIEYAIKHVPVGDDEKNRIFIVDVDNKKEDFIFTGSETLLRHVLFNLIQNSLIHAGSKAQIKLFIHENKIYVKDNGFGIPDDIYEKLFEKYTTTIGNGLGLHFCKQAMIKINGDIECMTEKGKGTQFVLSFDEG